MTEFGATAARRDRDRSAIGVVSRSGDEPAIGRKRRPRVDAGCISLQISAIIANAYR